MTVKTPLRYPGGKSRGVKFLDAFLPESIAEYREPFVGGGSVFLHARQKYPNAKFWINDAYYNLYCFWKELRDNGDRLVERIDRLKVFYCEDMTGAQIKAHIEQCELDGKEKSDFYKKQTEKGRALFTHAKDSIESASDFHKAAYFYVLNKCSYSGLTESGTFSPQASIQNFSFQSISKLKRVSELLQGVRITCEDYSVLLEDSSQESFIFMDPPYDLPVKSSNALYGKKGALHKTFDHGRYHFVVDSALRHKMMITYNNTEKLKDLYQDYRQIEWSLKYGMRITENKDGERRAKDCTNNELMITNYNTMCQYRKWQKEQREMAKKEQKKLLLKETRKAIIEVFGDFVAAENINESVYLSENDPGGWAPEAHIIINTENGLPSDIYDPFLAEKWIKVSDMLPDDYFVETINGAIMAVYDI
ncbi:hypothetical protein CL629_02155 [bacterium]|nr:hypothetical protein [bacterium]|tara:strand:+ start:1830 stop:3089 length:1260 start_codon:yes stop_codon:yes gene_type:complete